MGCCLVTDMKIQIIFSKFQAVPLSSLYNNRNNMSINSPYIPQLICGRILPATQPIICPVKQTQCVYYKVVVLKYNDDRNEWEQEFSEVQWRDFFLYDPSAGQSTLPMFVPANRTYMVVRGVDDGQLKSGAGKVSFFESEKLPPGIEELLKRQHYVVEVNVLIGKLKKKMSYEEESFDENEQIACLGVVQDAFDALNRPMKVLSPIQIDLIPDEFYSTNQWTEKEISVFKSLCSSPCIIVSDDRRLFQSVDILRPSMIPVHNYQQDVQQQYLQSEPHNQQNHENHNHHHHSHNHHNHSHHSHSPKSRQIHP